MTTGQDIVARIAIVRTQDHVRGCDGRHYSCDCGYERDLDGVLSEAAAHIERLEAQLAEARGEPDRIAEWLRKSCAKNLLVYMPRHDPACWESWEEEIAAVEDYADAIAARAYREGEA